MKICVYSDIHGNKEVLQNLQKSKDYQTADLRICLGDIVGMGPYPNECVGLISKSGDIALLGNHDVDCAWDLNADQKQYCAAPKLQHKSYMRKITSPENIKFLQNLEKKCFFECENTKFYFTHFMWNTDRTLFKNPDRMTTATAKTAKLFDGIDANYIFLGHNHFPGELEHGGKHFICPGSLGMKKEGNYCLVEIENGKITIFHKQIPFDVEKFKNDMVTSNYPNAKHYAEWL